MTTSKENTWKKHINIIKDAIFIIGIVVSSIGWIRSETIKDVKKQEQIENVIKEVSGNTKQLEKINDILDKQQELNGQIIMYMKMK